jgi:hypothetical protein
MFGFTRYRWKKPDGEQFAQETHRLVLKIEGKFSRLRANSAHFVGHLPALEAGFLLQTSSEFVTAV